MAVHVTILDEHEVPGKRLGRHVEHDPKSKDHAVEVATPIGALKAVHHRRYGKLFDQGQIGSCTGNAAAGSVNTVPLHKIGERLLQESSAVALYSLATHLDDIPGVYPPDDTGSSGLSAAKAAKQKGYIKSFKHAFNMDQALNALQIGPVITGVSWYEGFDHPDQYGMVVVSGQVRGGHEFVVRGFEPAADIADSVLDADNSWGYSWGLRGRFRFTVATWQQLMDNQGDVTLLLA